MGGGVGMAENVDNLILEQLRLIRQDLGEVKDRMGNLETGLKSVEGVLFGLAGYVRDIDIRVEHLETAMGVAQ